LLHDEQTPGAIVGGCKAQGAIKPAGNLDQLNLRWVGRNGACSDWLILAMNNRYKNKEYED
jgi:hypothetical protein